MAILKVQRVQDRPPNNYDKQPALIFIDNTQVGEVQFNSSSTFDVDPGSHLFGVRLAKNFGTKEQEIEVPTDGLTVVCSMARSAYNPAILFKPSSYWGIAVEG